MPERPWIVATPWLTSAALLAAGVAAWSVHPVAFDDAYITYRYAENALAGHGLVYEPGGERVEGFSNPLWLVLSWLALVVGGDAFATTRAVGVAFGPRWSAHHDQRLGPQRGHALLPG